MLGDEMTELMFSIIVVTTCSLGASILACIIVGGWADDREVIHDSEEPDGD